MKDEQMIKEVQAIGNQLVTCRDVDYCKVTYFPEGGYVALELGVTPDKHLFPVKVTNELVFAFLTRWPDYQYSIRKAIQCANMVTVYDPGTGKDVGFVLFFDTYILRNLD